MKLSSKSNMQMPNVAPKNIADARNRLRLTQPEFGQLCGVHWMTVSKWERGQLEPNAYQTALLNEFCTASKKRQIDDSVKKLLIGMGIAAALLFLLTLARK